MKKRNMTGMLVMLVFAIFMVSVLMILLTGADVLQKLSDRDQRSFDYRTAVQYISTRVHQADQAGMVSVKTVNDQSTLVLEEEIDGLRYETLVYCCDGYLREMYCEVGVELPLEFGEEILPMKAFQASQNNNTLCVELVMTDDSMETMFFHLRSEGVQVS